MKIISFAWTTGALLAGHKTVTRRDWNDRYAATFRPGELVQAYDRSPRFNGKPVAVIRILSVTKEADADAPDSDYDAEGFGWYFDREVERAWQDDPGSVPDSEIAEQCCPHGFDEWRRAGGTSWVVRFELVEVLT